MNQNSSRASMKFIERIRKLLSVSPNQQNKGMHPPEYEDGVDLAGTICEAGVQLPAPSSETYENNNKQTEVKRCQAFTKSGSPCGLLALKGSDYCQVHASISRIVPLHSEGTRTKCSAVTKNGAPCGLLASKKSKYCQIHDPSKMSTRQGLRKNKPTRSVSESVEPEKRQTYKNHSARSIGSVSRTGREPYIEIDLAQGSSEWLAWRNQGIGASDAPKIIGEIWQKGQPAHCVIFCSPKFKRFE